MQSNIVIGSVTKIRLKENRTCDVFFDAGVWSHPGGVYCDGNKREVSCSICLNGAIKSILFSSRSHSNFFSLKRSSVFIVFSEMYFFNF